MYETRVKGRGPDPLDPPRKYATDEFVVYYVQFGQVFCFFNSVRGMRSQKKPVDELHWLLLWVVFCNMPYITRLLNIEFIIFHYMKIT
jgi:hypothetical protein